MVKPMICICCGEELVIGIAEGAVLAQRLIINRIISWYKGEHEEHCNKKKRYPLLNSPSHDWIIQRENFRVKILLRPGAFLTPLRLARGKTDQPGFAVQKSVSPLDNSPTYSSFTNQ